MTELSTESGTRFEAGSMRSLISVHRVHQDISVEIPNEVVAASVQERIAESDEFDPQEATTRYALLLMGHNTARANSLPAVLREADIYENLCLLHLLISAYDPLSPNAQNDSVGIKSVLDVVQGRLLWLDQNGESARMFHYEQAVRQHMREMLSDELTWENGVLTEDGKVYLQNLIEKLARADDFANWLQKRSPDQVHWEKVERIRISDIAYAFSVQQFISMLYDGRKRIRGSSLCLRWDAALRSVGISLMHDGRPKVPKESQADMLRGQTGVDWYARVNGNGAEIMLPVEKHKIDMWIQLSSVLWPVVERLENTVREMGAGREIGEDRLVQFQSDLDSFNSIAEQLAASKTQPRTRVERVLALYREEYQRHLKCYGNLRMATIELRRRYPDTYPRKMRGLAEEIEALIHQPRRTALRLAALFSNNDLGGLKLTSETRLDFFHARNWMGAHHLFERTVLAGALFASDMHPVHLHLSTERCVEDDCTIVCLDDRSEGNTFARNLALVERHGHLFPNYIRDIPSLAAQVAPASMEFSITGSSIRFPIATPRMP